MKPECAVCLGEHDVEFHASTLRLRRWVRARLELAMRPVTAAVPKTRIAPGLPNLHELRSPASRKAPREMMRVIEAAAPEVSGTAPKTPTVESYLHALARACIEAAGNPQVRPLLFALLWKAPGTLATLAGAKAKRQIAA